MKLTDYTTLGRSGLRVSPLALGTMAFGTEWGWGGEETISRQIFENYIEASQPSEQKKVENIAPKNRKSA